MLDISTIVQQASFLWERDTRPIASSNPPSDATSPSLQRWIDIVADGDTRLFQLYLQAEDLNTETAARLITDPTLYSFSAIPAWVKEIEELIEFCNISSVDATPILPAEALPFIEILDGFCDFALYKFKASAVSKNDNSLDVILHGMLRELRTRLARITSPSIYCWFLLARKQGYLGELSNEEMYEAFTRRLLSSFDMETFFSTFPVVARLVGEALINWREVTSRFIERFGADLECIQGLIPPSAHVSHLSRLTSGLSDPHNFGDTVKLLEFDCGSKVIYKPRTLDIDVAFNSVLAWLNKTGALLSLKCSKVLARGDYGWVEFIDTNECITVEQAQRFYFRAGMLLFLVHLFEGCDFHFENIVISGEDPVLIDLEALFHPRFTAHEEDLMGDADQRSQEQIHGSVLRTGLLPLWIRSEKLFPGIDTSGLGGKSNQLLPWRQKVWKNLGTSQINLAVEHLKQTQNKSAPTIGSGKFRPNEFVENVCDGFSHLNEIVASRSQAFSRECERIGLFNIPTRYIHRDTSTYFRLLDSLYDPPNMIDGALFSLHLEALSSGRVRRTESSNAGIDKSEKRSLSRGDIPQFHVSPSGVLTFGLNDKLQPPVVLNAAQDAVRAHLESDSLASLHVRQCAFIRTAFYCSDYRVTPVSLRRQSNYHVHNNSNIAIHYNATEIAGDIADCLISNALLGKDGTVSWITLESLPRVEQIEVRPVGLDFYSGIGGLGVFFAAVASATNKSRYVEFMDRCIMTLENSIVGVRPALFAKAAGIGGLTGVASVVQSLVMMAKLSGRSHLYQLAWSFVNTISVQCIREDNFFDVLGGSAGCIPPLVALYHATGDDRSLGIAGECAAHLIENMVYENGVPIGIPTLGGNLVPGYAHGISGIASALLLLARSSKNMEHYREVGSELLSYESKMYSERVKNWIRPDGEQSMASWCNGAPGIGLVRLAERDQIDSSLVDRDLCRCIDVTKAFSIGSIDNFCCGNLGRAYFLMASGLASCDSGLVAVSRQISRQVVENARDQCGFSVSGVAGQLVPSFFQGLAGIGYTLLKLEAWNEFPDILI